MLANRKSNSYRFRRRLVICALILTLLIFTACGQQEAHQLEEGTAEVKQTIKIGYLPITHAGPIFVADHGLDADFELELVKFSSWPDLLDALNAGAIDGASVLIQLAMQAKAQGSLVKALALGHRDGNVIVSHNDIDDVEALIGENFAIPHRYSAHNMLLYRMLQQAGYEYSDVNVIELPPPEMPVALAEGRISGYSVAEPFGAHAVALGIGQVLYQSYDLWHDSLCCILVLREDFIEAHETLTYELVEQYVHGGNLADTKEEHVHEIMQDYLGVEEDVLELSLKWISYADLKLYPEEYEVLRELFIEVELNEHPPTYEEFFESKFIDKVM